jgi:hypothetical protein
LFWKATEEEILEELRGFKYWLDEPFAVADSPEIVEKRSQFPIDFYPEEDRESEMCFWSEYSLTGGRGRHTSRTRT